MREGFLNSEGYVVLIRHDHPRAGRQGNVPQHILVVEGVLGHFLGLRHQVHHVNENRSDNSNPNLVVCEDEAYHQLLHIRQRALDACGNANWRKCRYCKRHDDPTNLSFYFSGRSKSGAGYHRSCATAYQQRRRSAEPNRSTIQ